MKRKLKPSLTARKLKAVRKELKMTQVEFAKIMQCSPSSVAMKETGERSLTFEDEVILMMYQKLKIK